MCTYLFETKYPLKTKQHFNFDSPVEEKIFMVAQQIKIFFTNPVLESGQEADLSKNKIGQTILGKKEGQKLTY